MEKGFAAIIDYGVGNLKSVTNAMDYLGIRHEVTADAKRIALADALFLPGVGAFPDAAALLFQSGLDRVIVEQAESKPILGVCLGMQLLFTEGREGRVSRGLDLIEGTVRRIKTDLKLPHIGWNSLDFPTQSPLFKGIDLGSYVYFVHSFCGVAKNPGDVIATAEYGGAVTAAVCRNNVYGCQFHPEKSGEVGLQILKNFEEIGR